MLGIDVSKDTLVCTLLDPDTKKKLWSDEVPNTSAGIKRLLKKVPESAAWALEPTGRYGQTVAQCGRAAGRVVLLAQPKKTKLFLASIQGRAKTDRIDSHGIAMYALVHNLSLYPLKSPMIEELGQLLSARKKLSRSISSLKQQAGQFKYAAPHLQKCVDALKKEQEEINLKIKTLSEPLAGKSKAAPTDPMSEPEREALVAAVKRLRTVPGIGPVVANTVGAQLVSRHFPGSDQFVAFCGLDITVKESGKRSGRGAISKQGDAELRRALYLAAMATLRTKDSPFKEQYQRELAKGLSKTAALCSLARKLARLSWSLVTKGQEYNPARVYQQPHNMASKEKLSG